MRRESKIATINENINQAISDLNSIKTAITEKGVAVDDLLETSQYANKVRDVYTKGKQDEYNTFWDRF